MAQQLLIPVWVREMHIHGRAMQFDVANFNSSAMADKAAARRAADVRKKLMKAGLDIDGEPISEADVMIVRWLDGALYQPLDQNERQSQSEDGDQ